MRIDEILEALPGQVGTGFVGRALGAVGLGGQAAAAEKILGKVGLGGRAAAAEKAFIARAKQAYNVWLTQVPKLQQGGIAISDQKIYAQYFGRWMAPNLRLDKNDKIIKAAVRELSNAPNVEKKYMITLIAKMMGQQRALSIKTPSSPPKPPAPPPPPPPSP